MQKPCGTQVTPNTTCAKILSPSYGPYPTPQKQVGQGFRYLAHFISFQHQESVVANQIRFGKELLVPAFKEVNKICI